ncbi:MAG: pyruvate formate lyase family protein [Candidatus Helarchaeota archaeon]
MTGRTDAYRQMIYNAPYEICIERARYYTESYKETEGLHPTIRAAKALANTLEKMTIYILDQEQIVGNRSSKLVASVIPIERGELESVIKLDLKRMKQRQFKPFQISKADERELKAHLKYWKGKTVRDMKEKIWDKFGILWKISVGLGSWIRKYREFGWAWLKEYYKRLLKGRVFHAREGLRLLATNNPNFVNNVFDTQGHLVMGHKNILKWGFEGLKQLAEERLQQVTEALSNHACQMAAFPEEKSAYYDNIPDSWTPAQAFQARFSKKSNVTHDNKAFLEAVIISINAAIHFIKRFAKLAHEKASRAHDRTRQAELERISTICDWVATKRPRDFREALQLVWFNHVIATIGYGMGGILAVGRPDQYLYSFYKADIEAGRINNEEVTELCEELLIKLSYNLLMLPDYGKATASELGGDNAALTVGGIDKAGNDAVNELSYLFMDAIENVKSMTNSFSIRIHPTINSRQWIDRSIAVYSQTSGPALFNDAVIIPALQKCGVSLEDARDYAIIGCVEPTSQGNTFGTTSGNDISLVGLLEMVLTNGTIRTVHKQHGLKTGDPTTFKSYEEVWSAYLRQLNYLVDHMVKWVDIKDIIYAEHYPNPFISMTLDGCLENALDMTQGGATYNFSSISGRGLATVADSLAALRKLVFDEKEITIKEFLKILNHHYKKKEEFQLKLQKKLPKFGNDNDFVDIIAQNVAAAFCDAVLSHNSLRGGPYRPSFFSYGLFIVDGFLLGATPDGRNAGEPVSNSLSPVNNTERNGPTSVVKSIAKLDHSKISNGMALNMRLLPLLLETSEKRSKIADLTLTYFKLGGMEIQFNVVKQEELLDAQIYPENHQDLVIRVSGYSAYFIDVGKPVQDDIIARYEFSNW